MNADVVTLTFPTTSATYEAFTKLKNSPATSSIQTSALVERKTDGAFSIEEGDDAALGAGTLGGSLIGMTIGVLGGPLGMLLGWATGAATGSLVDTSHLDRSTLVLNKLADSIPPGHNAIIAECTGGISEVAQITEELGGTMTTVSRDELLNELEAQQVAAEEAARASHKAMREHKRQENRDDFETRMNRLRKKIHHTA